MTITVDHNSNCGTSPNVVMMIWNSGEEPTIIEYLKTPPPRDERVDLIRSAGLAPRPRLWCRGTPYESPDLVDPKIGDDVVIDPMTRHPILINRPIVVAPNGVKLCRPSGGGPGCPAQAAAG